MCVYNDKKVDLSWTLLDKVGLSYFLARTIFDNIFIAIYTSTLASSNIFNKNKNKGAVNGIQEQVSCLEDMGAVRSLESAFNPQEFSQRRQWVSIDLYIVCLRQLAAH